MIILWLLFVVVAMFIIKYAIVFASINKVVQWVMIIIVVGSIIAMFIINPLLPIIVGVTFWLASMFVKI